MKTFKYRLQALLNLKEHREREKQKEHATALQQVMNQTDRLKKIEGYKQDTYIDQRYKMTSNISVAELLVYSRYLLKLKRDRLTGEELLRVLEKNTEEKRQELIEASKQRQIHEKLREKQQERYDAEVRLIMTKENDETAADNYLRRERNKD
ncbi:MAG: flagellar export protein FliJ [candidate division Zixibacteria bacterium]|nr:flagellar export protein FliJ [candidate division Zixibacteria bacterium]